MASLMTEEFGISLRQLQILAVLWDAGKPIPRLELLEELHRRTGDQIEDVTLRSIMRRLDEKDMLARTPDKRKPGTMGRTPLLYSAKPRPQEILNNLLTTIFGDTFQDNPYYLEMAIDQLQKRLHKSKLRSPGAPP